MIVTDTAKALNSLRAHIDSEILEAMGLPVSQGHAPGDGPRPPSLGAIASRETIHFYLMAFARWKHFPLAATEQKNQIASYYPEADLWIDGPSYRALVAEYQRISEYAQLARETGGQGWNEPNPDRALSPGEQRRLAIRFGLAIPGAGKERGSEEQKDCAKTLSPPC